MIDCKLSRSNLLFAEKTTITNTEDWSFGKPQKFSWLFYIPISHKIVYDFVEINGA